MRRRIALAMLLCLGIAFVGPTPASAVVEVPWISVDKTVTADYYTPGDTITFKYVVTGNDRFDNLVVTDNLCSPVSPVLAGDGYNVGDLYGTKGVFNGLAGDAWEYTCQTAAPGAGAGGTNRTNTATVTGTSPWPVWAGMNPFTDTDTFTLERWVLRKHVVFYWDYVNEIVDPGAANVEFDVNLYKGTTAGNRVLVGTEKVSPAQPLYVWLTPGNWRMTEGTPPTGYAVLRGDWVIGDVPDAPGAPYPDNTFFNQSLFDLSIEKSGPDISFGSVTYTYQVTNTGPGAVAPAVTDNKCSPVMVPQVGDPAHNVGDLNDNGKIESTETWQYTCTYTPNWNAAFPNLLTNTATVADANKPTGAPWNLGQLMGGDTSAANNTDTYTLYPFVLRKDVGLYTGGTPNWAFADNTTFSVKAYLGGVQKAVFTISENSPKTMWLAAGTWTFQEYGLPTGYFAFYPNATITFVTGTYPDWTHLNVTWSGCSHGYWKNNTPWPASYLPGTLIESVFGEWDGEATATFADALAFGGGSGLAGGQQILLKQAVAALLNETQYGAAFGPYSNTAQLISAVNTALAGTRGDMTSLAGTLDYWNNGICRH